MTSKNAVYSHCAPQIVITTIMVCGCPTALLQGSKGGLASS